ncbi:META domain-containing protein [Maribacter dokdonensis]|uniref:META domain-containing protein n=1 Tax=Maribacter dokdonensis TaxID=320912 RepID=UPI001C096A1E|nr:META domain-containing protein [Maribacter dokdonensis]MBU2902936.1 META domain-containing protein [Maribacter dokdonensis]
MKYFTITLCILLSVSSCADKKSAKKNNNATVKEMVSDTTLQTKASLVNKTVSDNYFKASGTEPFWSLTISKKMIKLKTIGDSIMTPHTIPTNAKDSNVKQYSLQTEMVKMNIQINQTECINAMSGMASPYSVNIEFMKGIETEFTKLEGCGEYITDYRLYDIWVLEKLNGNEVAKESFKKDLPLMEINSASNSFTGYAGCNRMNGKLFSEEGVLRFTNIITTKIMCEPTNNEPEFLKALQKSTTYKIDNNRLTLSNTEGELLIFKKID